MVACQGGRIYKDERKEPVILSGRGPSVGQIDNSISILKL
jgi:hypothetical protein